jgi:hypothetical protein
MDHPQDSESLDDEPREVPAEPPSTPDSDLFLELEEADYGPTIHG